MDLFIDGYRYSGRFEIKAQTDFGTEMVDTEVGRHPKNWRRDWYEGKGAVTDRQTGARERFLFNPKGQSQEDIIILGKEVSREAIKDYLSVVDLALGLMYKSAQRSDKPVPSVTLSTLTLEMLTRAGLLQPDLVR